MNDANRQPGGPERKGWSARKQVVVVVSGVVGLIALYVLLPILTVVFVAQPVKVEGAAMSPTLDNGDRIFLNKRVTRLERNDIVVFYYPEDTTKSYIKRIIGLPGETIDVDSNGVTTINGQPIQESFLHPDRNRQARTRWSQVRPEWKQLKEGYYFMMGDNRDASNDSRSYGPIPQALIYGTLIERYWPLGKPVR